MLKKLMDQVHDYLEMPKLSRNFGTQKYEQQVVELSQAGERGGPGGGRGSRGSLGPSPRGRSLLALSSAFKGGVWVGRGLEGVAVLTARPQRQRPGSSSKGCVRFTCGATTTRCSSTTRSAPWTPWTH